MTTRQKLRLALFAGLAALFAFAIADTLGLREGATSVRGTDGYTTIPHGGHTHYVPNDWDGSRSVSDFPTSPPPAGMTVGPDGQFVPLPGR